MIINIMREKAFQKHSFLNYSSSGLFSAPCSSPLSTFEMALANGCSGPPRVTSQGTEGVVPAPPHLSAPPTCP